MLTDSQDSRIMAAATARMVHYDDCTLRKRISKLRDRWYEENLSNNINNDGIKVSLDFFLTGHMRDGRHCSRNIHHL